MSGGAGPGAGRPQGRKGKILLGGKQPCRRGGLRSMNSPFRLWRLPHAPAPVYSIPDVPDGKPAAFQSSCPDRTSSDLRKITFNC